MADLRCFISQLRTYNHMSKQQAELSKRLLTQHIDNPKETPPIIVATHTPLTQFTYKQRGEQPTLNLSKPALLILAPIFIIVHFWISDLANIPVLQYIFVTSLFAFLLNYMFIIRQYGLYPYLPDAPLDNRLKMLCVVSFGSIVSSMYLGWNGSGGVLFAIYWEVTRGQRMNMYGLFFGAIILGSLLMQENYSVYKLWEFLPGLLLGWVNSEIFKLKQSNEYTILHQFLFTCSVGFPLFFLAANLVVPSIWQWLLMIVCGGFMLVTLVMLVKVQQTVRVSVVVGVMAGLLMVGTSAYTSHREYLGALMILGGTAMMLKTEFADSV